MREVNDLDPLEISPHSLRGQFPWDEVDNFLSGGESGSNVATSTQEAVNWVQGTNVNIPNE